jgi:hypothetical protein
MGKYQLTTLHPRFGTTSTFSQYTTDLQISSEWKLIHGSMLVLGSKLANGYS